MTIKELRRLMIAVKANANETLAELDPIKDNPSVKDTYHHAQGRYDLADATLKAIDGYKGDLSIWSKR